MKKLIYIIPFVFLLVNTRGQSLDDYLLIARKNNSGLKAKHEEFEAALQRIPQVSAIPDPEFSVASFGQMVETRVGQQMARLSLSQMFPWFGTLAAQKNAAAISAQAVYDSYLDARNELNFKVRASYYPLIEINHLILLQEKNLKILSTMKTLATSQFQNGSGKLADALRVDIMMNDLKTEIQILNQKRKPLEVAFNKLLNRSSDETINTPDEFDLPENISFSVDSIEYKNPKLNEFDKRISATRSQELVAIKQGMPRLGLGFEYFVTAKRPNMTFEDNGKDAWMPMVTVSLPIYRNKYKASVSEAKHMQQSFTEMKAEVANQLTSAFEIALFELEKANEEINLFNNQIQQSQQIVDLLLAAYGNSESSFEEILRMQQMLIKYEMNKVVSAKNYLISEAQLKYLVAKD